MTRSTAALIAIATAGLLGACSLLAPSDDELRRGGRAADAAPSPDGAAVDGPVVGAVDGSVDGAPAVSYALDDTARWSALDLRTLLAAATDFAGGTFDGRYVYLVPGIGGFVARYDTAAPFTGGDAWTFFDTRSLDAKAVGYRGAAFDGRYLYLPPHGDRTGSLVARYDTKLPFGDKASWTLFDSNVISPEAEGFEGAVFDGRYIYYVPFENEGGDYIGVVLRYDTTQDFKTPAAYALFDTKKAHYDANGFHGGVFDGRYVLFVPSDNGVANGVATRFDTTRPFTDATSWEALPLGTVSANLKSFAGGAFDGRYAYLAPALAGERVLRSDTQAALSGSFSSFDLAAAGGGGPFGGAVFDGRYVYFAPAQGGRTVRLDSTKTFFEPASWQAFDLRAVAAAATSYAGAIFDGRYVYYVPTGAAPVLRFEARSAPLALSRPGLQPSFY